MVGKCVREERIHCVKGKRNEILSEVLLIWFGYGVYWLLQTDRFKMV